MKNIFLLIILSAVVFSSCTRQTIEPGPDDLGYDFYPLETGKYVMYKVDSVYFNDFTRTNDTVSLEVRDEIGESFVDNQGQESYIVNRTKRYTSSAAWASDHTYYVTRDNFKLEWQENNLRFIKMIYPVKVNGKWFGNSYLSTHTNPEIRWYDNWEYRYTDVQSAFNSGFKTYPITHTIYQSSNQEAEGDPNNPNSYSAFSYGQETYAKGVGMVFKELTRWEFQPSGNNWRKGFSVTMRAFNNN